VTGVIRSALAAGEASGWKAAVLIGEPPHKPLPSAVPHRVLKKLAYGARAAGLEAGEIARKALQAAQEALGAQPDLWHIHNHCLGKNATLPLLVAELARRGRRLLLQIHDFPEDFRPENWRLLRESFGIENLDSILYPRASHVHYAVLNTRDERYLKEAGLETENLHFLPNTVGWEEECPTEEQAPGRDLFLYPTRAIRRKNLGEFLLWSAVAPEGIRFATTLEPKNPAARPVYERWIRVAKELELPVSFAVGEKTESPYPRLLRSARALVTTSVAEGFGLAFLEPWLVGRPLVGRDLPEVTETITNSGIELVGLYESLTFPEQWVGREALLRKLRKHVPAVYRAYGLPAGEVLVERIAEAIVRDGRIEFGALEEELQELVLRRLVSSPRERSGLSPSWIDPGVYSEATLSRNKRATQRAFGRKAYRKRLEEIYLRVASSETSAVDHLSGERLLQRFLAPERFSLLRTT